jgi:ribosomal protein S18 acetylase RimI-like enzyme
MAYRLTSTWQDQGCEIGIWKNDDKLLAWAVFQPPWWNLDYALHPSERGSPLEDEVMAWGQDQIKSYSRRIGEEFYGSVEFFEDMPKAEQTADHLEALGFMKFDWSTVRFEIDLHRDLPRPQLPKGFTIRPLRGNAEVETYVSLHRAAFGSEKMTTRWRMRTLEHPAYIPEIDLVIVGPEDKPVGFCICWIWQEIGQIEPLGVHPEYHSKGLGRALELAALLALWNQGARIVYIDHMSINEKAIAVSLQTGFRQSNNALRYYINANM